MHQNISSLLLKTSDMFRPCLAVFRENSLDTLVALIQCIKTIVAEDGPAGSKYVGSF
jgi:hypothetical protein